MIDATPSDGVLLPIGFTQVNVTFEVTGSKTMVCSFNVIVTKIGRPLYMILLMF